MMRNGKLLLLLLALSICVSSMAWAAPETVDLSRMTREELTELRNRVDAEIRANHTTTSSEESIVLNLTKAFVENEYKKRGISVSWPWFDYSYTREWDFYTVDTRINYRSGSKSYEERVYSELYNTNGNYQLYYVRVGEEELLNDRASMPALNGAQPEAETATPVKRGGIMNVTPQQTATPTPRPTARATATPTAKGMLGIGDTGTLSPFRVTLNGGRRSSGSTWNEPEAGNEFVLLEFVAENISKDTEYFNSLMQFEVYCDGFAISYSFSASLEAKGDLAVNVAPGKKTKGEYGLELPKGWKELEIHYVESSFWSSKEIVFLVEASQIR